jgi:hypothetical protein
VLVTGTGTGREHASGLRRLPAAGRQNAAGNRAVEARPAREQPARVRVTGVEQDLRRRRGLDDPSRVGDHDPVADARRDTEVVRHEQQRRPALPGRRREQVEHPRLHGDIERGRRLVGDDEPRIARERHRDHHTLAQPAGQLVRVAAHLHVGLRDPGLREQLDQLVVFGIAGGLRDLVGDPHRRIQRSHRILEDGRDVAAAAGPALILGGGEHVLAVEPDSAAEDRRRLTRQKAEGGETENALPGPGLADQADDLAGRDRERGAPQRVDVAPGSRERNVQVLYLERRHRCLDAHAAASIRPPSAARTSSLVTRHSRCR